MAVIRFFSFAPRIARARWLAWFTLALGILVLAAIALARVEGIALVSVYALLGLVAAKLATETVRRLHDVGQSGWMALAVGVGIAALLATAIVHAIGYGSDAISWGALALAAISGAVLTLRPGTPAANAYGAPPPPLAASPAEEGRAGLFVAVLFLLAGIGTGLGVRAWQDDLARQSEARMQRPEPVDPVAAPEPSATPRDPLANDNAALSNRIDDLLKESPR